MTALLAWLSARNKALAAAAIGAYGWGMFVVDSAPKAVTAHEWMLLASVGLGVLGVHQVPNILASPQAPQAPVAMAVEQPYQYTPAFTPAVTIGGTVGAQPEIAPPA